MTDTVTETPARTETVAVAAEPKRQREPLDLVPILALGVPILVGIALLITAAVFLIVRN